MSLTGSNWESSKTFHPWLWRLDQDFLVWLKDCILVMLSLLSWETLRALATEEQLWGIYCLYMRHIICLSPGPATWSWTSRVIWTALPPLGVRSEVWGFAGKACCNINYQHGAERLHLTCSFFFFFFRTKTRKSPHTSSVLKWSSKISLLCP